MELFVLNNRSLSAKITGRIKSGPAYVAETCNVLFNCIERAVIHNDATWLNRGAAYARASGPYITAFMSVAKSVAPFKFENGEFGGKVLKPKRDKWRTVENVEHGDFRDERWYQHLEQKFDEMLKDRTDAANRKNKGEFDLEKWLKRTIAKAAKEDCLAQLIQAAQAAKTTPVQEVAQAIKNEDAAAKAEERKAA